MRDTMATKTLPSVVGGAGGLARYLEEIRKFPKRSKWKERFKAIWIGPSKIFKKKKARWIYNFRA